MARSLRSITKRLPEWTVKSSKPEERLIIRQFHNASLKIDSVASSLPKECRLYELGICVTYHDQIFLAKVDHSSLKKTNINRVLAPSSWFEL